MVYGIVDQSKGSVHIESSAGLGTVVTVRLPAALGSAPYEASPATPRDGRPLRILLAEDEPGVRELVALILRDVGHFVILAADGPSAVEEAERAEFDFDAAVVDVVMPYMSGPELVNKLRRRLPTLPVVFISGYSNLPPAEIQGEHVQTEYVQKPFQARDLLTALDRALRT
jgi:CheY-like chemotaxis protein